MDTKTLTMTQQVALAIAPKIAAALSMIGSGWIIIEVLSCKTKRGTVFHRILLAMSIYDVMESSWHWLSTWPIPKGTEGYYAPRGNAATCSAQGFFIQFGLAVPLLNAMLSLYYLLVIKYGWKEDKLKRSVEPWMQLVPLILALGTATAGATLDLYHAADLWCWLAPPPEGTHDLAEAHRYGEYRWGMYYGPLWLSLAFSVVALWLVYTSVRKKELQSLKYRRPSLSIPQRRGQPQSTSEASASPTPCGSDGAWPSISLSRTIRRVDTSLRSSVENRRRRRDACPRTRQVLEQARWFTCAFLITHVFSTINRTLQLGDITVTFPLILLHSVFDPLQGLSNFSVYRRPVYLRRRQMYPESGRWSALRYTFKFHFQSDPEEEKRKRHHRNVVGSNAKGSGLPSRRRSLPTLSSFEVVRQAPSRGSFQATVPTASTQFEQEEVAGEERTETVRMGTRRESSGLFVLSVTARDLGIETCSSRGDNVVLVDTKGALIQTCSSRKDNVVVDAKGARESDASRPLSADDISMD